MPREVGHPTFKNCLNFTNSVQSFNFFEQSRAANFTGTITGRFSGKSMDETRRAHAFRQQRRRSSSSRSARARGSIAGSCALQRKWNSFFRFFFFVVLFAFSVIDVTPRRPREGRQCVHGSRRFIIGAKTRDVRVYERSRVVVLAGKRVEIASSAEVSRPSAVGKNAAISRVRERPVRHFVRTTRGTAAICRGVFAIEFADNRVRITAPKPSVRALTYVITGVGIRPYGFIRADIVYAASCLNDYLGRK